MLATKNICIAYENWCLATHAPKWSQVWDIVQQVDGSNVGLCLDMFQTCGGEWADPTTPSGIMLASTQNDVTQSSVFQIQLSFTEVRRQLGVVNVLQVFQTSAQTRYNCVGPSLFKTTIFSGRYVFISSSENFEIYKGFRFSSLPCSLYTYSITSAMWSDWMMHPARQICVTVAKSIYHLFSLSALSMIFNPWI